MTFLGCFGTERVHFGVERVLSKARRFKLSRKWCSSQTCTPWSRTCTVLYTFEKVEARHGQPQAPPKAAFGVFCESIIEPVLKVKFLTRRRRAKIFDLFRVFCRRVHLGVERVHLGTERVHFGVECVLLSRLKLSRKWSSSRTCTLEPNVYTLEPNVYTLEPNVYTFEPENVRFRAEGVRVHVRAQVDKLPTCTRLRRLKSL